MSPHPGRTNRSVDPFTATAGACLLLVIAAGFLSLSVHALATGCIRIRPGHHGPGVVHCSPESSYWIATLSLLVLGLAVIPACLRLFGHVRRSPRGNG